MPAIDTPGVIRLLREFGQRVALRGGNPYRAKAYTRAAESLATLTVPLAEVVREGRLRQIPGVGEAIANVITRLHQTGTHPALEAMRKEIPTGVLEMLSIPGLRPEKVMKLYKELGITSLAALEEAAKADRPAGQDPPGHLHWPGERRAPPYTSRRGVAGTRPGAGAPGSPRTQAGHACR
jgi:DNA polymerase (family 10)